ncbi:MAG TPA: glycosyltransferase [Candidatus Saccharimonadales bacterium]|nr:glycosyltransferase [Candidatus Saccharimonadales bacterium]
MRVLIYPKSINPYHELLYSPIRAAHPADKFTYLAASPRNLLFFPLAIAVKRLQGYRVFHLHWHTFYLDAKYGVPGRKFISLINTLICLGSIKLLGYKLVWTVHNVLPHEPQTSNDRVVTRLTARAASALIVHSAHTIAELHEQGADTSKAVIIPHGNYDGIYPRSLSRAQARAKLGIKPHEKVVLFFGNLRPHKGVEDLLAAYTKLAAQDAYKNTRLVIAGACRDASLGKIIADTARKSKHILYREGNVADEDVAMYFDASDIACLPFQSVTTSGSIILAATFGMPLVTPRLGAIKEIPAGAGVLYDPSEKDALQRALQKTFTTDASLPKMAKASRGYADSLAWENIARKTYAVLRKTLAGSTTAAS